MLRPIRFAVLLAGVTLAFTALAQPAPDDGPAPGQSPDQSSDQGPAADPPTRVARLAFVSGDVSFVPAGENDWVQAQLNRPLITGDKLWTDRNSRTELEIGSSTMRMDQDTSFDFLNLDDKIAQVELTEGTLNLRVRRLYDDQSYEIDTPTLAFVINRVGEYRIDVQPNGQGTVVSVLHGGGDTYGEGGARFRVEEGQSVTFNDPQLQNYQSNNLSPPDDFDSFCAQRDGRWDNAKSRQFVSEDVIGYQDLDDNGNWDDVPEYGNVWYPTTVDVGWSPYHSGHWGWVGAYGWSWVDDAPWGFAPFHYGRWAYIGNRWGWCPGPIGVRAVYAPALVAFVGGGVGVSIGFGAGPVGWFPLGPRDVYYPGYHVSERYFSSINISNGRGFDRGSINGFYGNYSHGRVDYEHINYANRHVAGAVVAVPAAAFIGARSVRGSAIAVNHETFANSRVSGFAAVAPTRASLAPGSAAHSLPPAALANRRVVAATKPPPPAASFAQRQTLLQKNPGQPLRENQLRAPVTANAAGVGARQNLRVVTNNGAPVHSAAPALPARSAGAVNAHVAPGGGAGPATAHSGPGNPTNQSNRANMPNATTGASAAIAGHPATNSHVDSSRFAHPGGNPATPVTAAGASPHAATGQGSLPAVQRGAAGNAQLRSNSNAVGTSHSAVSSNSNAVQGKPEYRQSSAGRGNQDYHAPVTNNNPRGAQEYHAPVTGNNNAHANGVQGYQQHAVPTQQYQAQQQHVAPPGQMQQQRVAPQMQQHAPAAARAAPAGKERKDDDKKHGG